MMIFLDKKCFTDLIIRALNWVSKSTAGEKRVTFRGSKSVGGASVRQWGTMRSKQKGQREGEAAAALLP